MQTTGLVNRLKKHGETKTDTWTEKAPISTARHHHTSAVVDGKLYVIGDVFWEMISSLKLMKHYQTLMTMRCTTL